MSAPKLTEAQVAQVRKFANARVNSERFASPPDEPLSYHWRPKLAGRLVHNAGDPPEGYADHRQANEAARRYRDGCRAYLATLGRERDDAMTTHPDSDRRG
jgi:hypothetical protein